MELEPQIHSVSIKPAPFAGEPGGLCRKGWTAAAALGNETRLISPMCRDTKFSSLRPCTWEEALSRVTDAITRSQTLYGRDSVGIFGGGGLTNEKAYYLGKFARVTLGTRFIDYNGRFCMSSAAAALNRSFGLDRGLPFPMKDMAHTDVVLLVGSNMAETMPPAMRYLKEMESNGGQLIVVDPRKTPTAKAATLHLQLVPGSDLALANGLLHIAIGENYIDQKFISERTTHFDEIRETVMAYWPERVEKITGISVSLLYKTAKILGESDTGMILTARGAEQHSSGTDTTSSFLNLALALGKVGKPYCGFGTLTGQGNGQGGREHGQKADQLPGYRSISDPNDRATVAKVWGVDPASLPTAGISAYELLTQIGQKDGVRCLIVMGSNPLVSAPNSNEVERNLKLLDFLVVVDPFVSETASIADVILPSAQWAEETGTMTNAEGRVILRKASLQPPSEVKSDLEIISELAKRMGHGEKFNPDPRKAFEELGDATRGARADYSGISYEQIESNDGIHWPCNEEFPNGTPRLFLERFSTPSGKARLFPTQHRGPSEALSKEYPVYLITGRTLLQYQSGTQTRRIVELRDKTDAFVEIHPLLAEKVGIKDGQPVTLRTTRGQATVTARLSTDMRTDTVFVPFHWPDAERANLLTNPALDPISKMPEFKVCAVSIAPVEAKAG